MFYMRDSVDSKLPDLLIIFSLTELVSVFAKSDFFLMNRSEKELNLTLRAPTFSKTHVFRLVLPSATCSKRQRRNGAATLRAVGQTPLAESFHASISYLNRTTSILPQSLARPLQQFMYCVVQRDTDVCAIQEF